MARPDVMRQKRWLARNARLASQQKKSLPKINFILRQSDDDLACIAIHDSRTILKLYVDEHDLKRLANEVADALAHLRQSRNLKELVARNLKKTRFPRRKAKP